MNKEIIKVEDRFMLKVNKTDTCWLWLGNTDKDGYGRFPITHNKEMRAHRFAYELFKDKIPSSKVFVCHECDNPACVNPEHLWLGDALSNNSDARRKGRSVNVKGEENGLSKLTWKQVREIRMSAFANMHMLAKKYGVSRRNIGMIISNVTWKE